MSAVKLTVIFTLAISRGDYLAKSAEKANALRLTINHGEGPDNRHVWLTVITHDGCACRARMPFWSRKPNPISALPPFSRNEPQAICAIPCSSFSYPPLKGPLVCYATLHRKSVRWTCSSDVREPDTPVVPQNPFPSCGLRCDSFCSIDTTNGCQCRENWSPE